MHSRSVLGRRLDLPGIVPSPVDVLLIESEAARGVTVATADTIGDEENYRLVMQVLLEIARCMDEDDVRPGTGVPAVDLVSGRA